jgi:uncharacterized oligopeptide transporter (OPT) family protein
MKIRQVGPLSVGKIFGAIYCAFGVLIGLFVALFLILGGAIAANQQGAAAGVPPVAIGIAVIIFAPIFYGLTGFLGGLISAALYNLAAGFLGGIEVDLGE